MLGFVIREICRGLLIGCIMRGCVDRVTLGVVD